MAWKDWENFVPPDASFGTNIARAVKALTPKRSKYGAQPTEVDGIRFHSKKESERYQELKAMEKAGEINQLQLQPEFTLWAAANVLISGDEPKELGRYVADFAYTDKRTRSRVVEDVKGFKTPLYRWKKKHVEAQYGITIREI